MIRVPNKMEIPIAFAIRDGRDEDTQHQVKPVS